MENEIQDIIRHNIEYYVMLRDLDPQYQQCFDEMIAKSAEEINSLVKS